MQVRAISKTVSATIWIALLALGFLVGCGNAPHAGEAWPEVLEMTTLGWQKNADFEAKFFTNFGERHHVRTQYLPNLETVDSRLGYYKQLFNDRSPQPGIVQLDMIWPAILADDLVDLKPYLGAEIADFAPELIANYTVSGRLVALPTFVDIGVLYYRPELLRKYGYERPPASWQELESMSRRIQAGERRAGNKDFWGYVWQGGRYEGLTCNAIEWQTSEGEPNFIANDRTIHVYSPRMIFAMRRAANWIGTISPPGESVYREPDTANLWNIGNAAFLRSWASSYGALEAKPGNDGEHFGVAPLPSGASQSRGVLGGLAVGVSKFALDRELAVQAVRELTSAENDRQRVLAAETIPVRTAVRQLTEIKNHSGLHRALGRLMAGAVARPSTIAASQYDRVSIEYSSAINSILQGRQSPEAALTELEAKLVRVTRFKAVRP